VTLDIAQGVEMGRPSRIGSRSGRRASPSRGRRAGDGGPADALTRIRASMRLPASSNQVAKPAEAPMSDTIIARCEAKGLRMTGQRRTIASVLEAADDHPHVEELYTRASAVDPKISLATVYMDNLRGILWMIAAMAGFALEDAFIKLAAGALALGPVVAVFGLGRLPVLHGAHAVARAAARHARHLLAPRDRARGLRGDRADGLFPRDHAHAALERLGDPAGLAALRDAGRGALLRRARGLAALGGDPRGVPGRADRGPPRARGLHAGLALHADRHARLRGARPRHAGGAQEPVEPPARRLRLRRADPDGARHEPLHRAGSLPDARGAAFMAPPSSAGSRATTRSPPRCASARSRWSRPSATRAFSSRSSSASRSSANGPTRPRFWAGRSSWPRASTRSCARPARAR
jgi:hypothetical protein